MTKLYGRIIIKYILIIITVIIVISVVITQHLVISELTESNNKLLEINTMQYSISQKMLDLTLKTMENLRSNTSNCYKSKVEFSKER